MQIVDFFIVGAQKAGTTALDRILRAVPSVQMANNKEVHFFDQEDGVDWVNPSFGALHDAFDWSASDKKRGETTPIYMYWTDAIRRIHAYNPNAKLIVLLRQPVYRAYSHWKMTVYRGKENLSFNDAVSSAGRRRITESGANERLYSYVERGLYRGQIERIFELFPRNQVLLIKSDEFRVDPSGTLLRVCDLIGTPLLDVADADVGYTIAVDTRSIPDMRQAEAARYLHLFRDDIIGCMAVTGIDLSDWLEPDYREYPI